FAELPGFYLGQGIPGLSQELFDSLNSQRYFTVYPPINQGIFWLSVVVSDNWLVSAGVIRLFLLSADLVAFYFIRKILIERGGNQNLAFLFFLNPLVILEGVGNLHFEVMVCAFLAFGIYFFYKKKAVSVGVGFGLAIGTKLLPLIFIPYFFFKEILSKKILMTFSIVLITLVSIAPLLNAAFIEGLQSSLGLYFTNFEFNASLFGVARELSVEATGYNKIKIIGPIFSIASAVGILAVSFLGARRNMKVETILLLALVVYLAFATTVHPWYILPLVLFGILSGYVFPIIWSLMIFITYAGYSAEGYSLHWFWIALEYIIVVLSFIFNDRIKKWLTIS
ncbi:MAG: glycosyltransferase 87 family protein, partial [Cyclobacteriaceae bacterium]